MTETPTTRRARSSNQDFWKKPLVRFAAVGVAGLLIGTALGSSGKPAPVVQQVPGPERVVTKEVEKEVTPKSCLTAMDLSEEGFGLAAKAMGYMSDALTAAAKFDVASLTQANTDLDAINPQMKEVAAPMKAAVSECRAAAK